MRPAHDATARGSTTRSTAASAAGGQQRLDRWESHQTGSVPRAPPGSTAWLLTTTSSTRPSRSSTAPPGGRRSEPRPGSQLRNGRRPLQIKTTLAPGRRPHASAVAPARPVRGGAACRPGLPAAGGLCGHRILTRFSAARRARSARPAWQACPRRRPAERGGRSTTSGLGTGGAGPQSATASNAPLAEVEQPAGRRRRHRSSSGRPRPGAERAARSPLHVSGRRTAWRDSTSSLWKRRGRSRSRV
jgi:hypothetical protein